MVSGLSILSMCVALLICFLFPVGLAIYYYKKERISILAILIGALTFIVFQIVTRVPIISYCSTQPWYAKLASNPIVLALILAFTAGLFEEGGRFIFMKLFMKKRLEWKNGIAFGIGHGGIEAVLIVGLGYINNIFMSFLINKGIFDTVIAPKMPAETAIYIKDALINGPAYLFAAGGIERIFTIVIQIALSLVVLYGIINKKNICVLYAILLHTLVDFVPGVLALSGVSNILLLEVIVFVFAVAGVIYIKKSKQLFAASKRKDEIEENSVLNNTSIEQ